jgi:hypothetical protein
MIYKTEIENTITIQRLCFTSTYIESSPHVMVIQILVYCPVHQLKKLNCNCGYDTSLLCGILAVINLTDTTGYSFNQVRHTNSLVIDNNYIFFFRNCCMESSTNYWIKYSTIMLTNFGNQTRNNYG